MRFDEADFLPLSLLPTADDLDLEILEEGIWTKIKDFLQGYHTGGSEDVLRKQIKQYAIKFKWDKYQKRYIDLLVSTLVRPPFSDSWLFYTTGKTPVFILEKARLPGVESNDDYTLGDSDIRLLEFWTVPDNACRFQRYEIDKKYLNKLITKHDKDIKKNNIYKKYFTEMLSQHIKGNLKSFDKNKVLNDTFKGGVTIEDINRYKEHLMGNSEWLTFERFKLSVYQID